MFQFMTATRIIFGENTYLSSLSLLSQFGYSVLLVTGKELSRAQPVIDYLQQQKMRYQHIVIRCEPNITMVEEAAVAARKFKPDLVVAVGGGSAVDMGKALSAMIPNHGSVYDYVEVVGRCVPLKTKPIPFIAIPSLAGSGAEVTRKAVLKSGQDRVKVSLRSAELLPDVAIVDPCLTYGMSSLLAGRGAMEAFVHLMEAYVCSAPNPLTDMVCEQGLTKLSRAILPACLDDDKRARGDLSFSAMLGGMAVSNAKQGAAHGLAAALGGKLEAPHSMITSRLAPHVMGENIIAARRKGREDILQRYRRIAYCLTGKEQQYEESCVTWSQEILDRLQLPKLDAFGVCHTSFEQVADDALKSVSIRGNPLPLTKDRLVHILQQVCSCSDCTETHPRQEEEVKTQFEMWDDVSDYTQREGQS